MSQPSAADNVSSEIPSDIGSIITPSKSIDDVYQSMKTMDNAEKYSLLFNHVRPPDNLPTTYSHGCNRTSDDKQMTSVSSSKLLLHVNTF